MRLVFISSVTAMPPFRTISAITGSRARRFEIFFPRFLRNFFAIAPSVLMIPDRFQSILSPLPDRDAEGAESIDLQHVAWHQHRRRCILLDQRRTLDAVAGHERCAREGARVDEAMTLEINWPFAGACRLGRHDLAVGDLLRSGLAHDARDRGAQADDLGALGGRTGAVAQQMHVVEMALDGAAILFFEHPHRQVDRDGMLLADIAHIDGTVGRYLLGRYRGACHGAPALAFELIIDARDVVERS